MYVLVLVYAKLLLIVSDSTCLANKKKQSSHQKRGKDNKKYGRGKKDNGPTQAKVSQSQSTPSRLSHALASMSRVSYYWCSIQCSAYS